MSNTTKPEIVRQLKDRGNDSNNTQIKQSILSDVDKLRVDKGKKSGGV